MSIFDDMKEKLSKKLFNIAGVILIAINEDGIVYLVNKKAAEILGF